MDKNLSPEKIAEIIQLDESGFSAEDIATVSKTDYELVAYYLTQHEAVKSAQREYEYSFTEYVSRYDKEKDAKEKVCTHPSWRCSLCGKWKDNIKTRNDTVQECLSIVENNISKDPEYAIISIKALIHNH